MKGAGTLIAWGTIDASVTTITYADFVALPLFDPKGNPITNNVLPWQCRKIQFAANVSKNFYVGLKTDDGNFGGYEIIGVGQQDALDSFIPQQQVGLKAFDADITEGLFGVYFYS